jgi:hypothetical protein
MDSRQGEGLRLGCTHRSGSFTHIQTHGHQLQSQPSSLFIALIDTLYRSEDSLIEFGGDRKHKKTEGRRGDERRGESEWMKRDKGSLCCQGGGKGEKKIEGGTRSRRPWMDGHGTHTQRRTDTDRHGQKERDDTRTSTTEGNCSTGSICLTETHEEG